MTKIIQGRKYKLLVDIRTLDDSFFVAQGGIFTVKEIICETVNLEYKVCATTIKAKLPLTTFIHCTELVGEEAPITTTTTNTYGMTFTQVCTCGNQCPLHGIARELSGK